MNKKTYYGFVETDGGMKYRTSNEPSLDEMQKWVGGLIEYAPVRPGAQFQYHVNRETMVWGETLEVIVNEEGLLLNLESNEIASIAGHKGPAEMLGTARWLTLRESLSDVPMF